MRIGILTFHRAYNCGAMLQAWALKKVLERMGHTVEFPNCNNVGASKRWTMPWTVPENCGFKWWRSLIYRSLYNLGSIPCEDILRARYRKFAAKHLSAVDVKSEDLSSRYDLLVYGSDQIWNPEICLEDTGYFLGEGVAGVRKIAYAASYGDKPLEGNALDRVVSAARQFDAISVREAIVKEQLEPLVGKSIEETLDPTLLLSAEDYDEIAEGDVPREPYLFLYTLFTTPFVVNTAKELARRLGVKCVIAPCNQYTRFGAMRGLTYSVSPDRLVQLARNASYILASSFHGTVMGVVFKKPFLSLRNQVDQFESRPAALLRKLGTPQRLVDPSVKLDDMESRLREDAPDYASILEALREKSLRWMVEQHM